MLSTPLPDGRGTVVALSLPPPLRKRNGGYFSFSLLPFLSWGSGRGLYLFASRWAASVSVMGSGKV